MEYLLLGVGWQLLMTLQQELLGKSETVATSSNSNHCCLDLFVIPHNTLCLSNSSAEIFVFLDPLTILHTIYFISNDM